MNELIWQIPLGAFFTVILLRLALAPYWIYKDKDLENANLRQEKQKLEQKLVKTEDKSYAIVWNTNEWLLQMSNGWRSHQENESDGIGLILDGYVTIITFKRILIESIQLDIGGTLFPSDWKAFEYVGYDEPSVRFYIGFDTQRGKRTAVLKAIVDGKEYISEPFTLDLPQRE